MYILVMGESMRRIEQMRKTMLLLFVLSSLVVFSLVAANTPSFNDRMDFTIDLHIRNRAWTYFAVNEFENSPFTIVNETNQLSINPESDSVGYEICIIEYKSNILGPNNLFISATPFFLVDDSGNIVQEHPATGYSLNLNLVSPEWTGTLEVDSAQQESELTIPLTVSSRFSGAAFEFRVEVHAVFTNLDSMIVGRYISNIRIGRVSQ